MSRLYIKQKLIKILDRYDVYNQKGEVVYKVRQSFRPIGHKVKVYDKNGDMVFTIKKKIISILPKYTVKMKDVGKIVIRQKISLFRKKFTISSSDYDLNMKGDFFLDKNYDIYESGNKIATIGKKIISIGDTYQIKVYDDKYEELSLALMIAVDNLLDSERDGRLD